MQRRASLLAVLCAAAVPFAWTQAPPSRLTFEVATIKPSDPNTQSGGIKPLPGGDGYMAQNVSIRLIISLMYQVPLRQVTGGPDWIDSARYDIEAKADRSYSKDELHEMFRNLLADRFNLKLRKETREGPVYALMVDKSGLKMKVNDSPQDFKIPITYDRNNAAVGVRVPMQYLCWWLGLQLQQDKRPVIDKTGLTGNYDFTLSYASELSPNVSPENMPLRLQNLPSIFDALKEQLGLKLQPATGPVDSYVVDHIDRPSPD